MPEASKSADLVQAELSTDYLPRIEEKAFHISVKDNIREYFQRTLDQPGNTTNFVFDYKAVCVFLPVPSSSSSSSSSSPSPSPPPSSAPT